MSNPYSSPGQTSRSPRSSSSQGEVNGPAIALIAVSVIAIVFGVLGLAGDVALLMSGAIEQLEAMNNGPVSKYTTIMIRMIWGGVLLIAACFVLFGSLKMKQLKDYPIARAAAVVAVVPLLGPCCVLGIPFGIWALVVLGKPHVRDAFR